MYHSLEHCFGDIIARTKLLACSKTALWLLDEICDKFWEEMARRDFAHKEKVRIGTEKIEILSTKVSIDKLGRLSKGVTKFLSVLGHILIIE